ncbi:hypothetical protein BOM24_00055 [Tatumella sp. OPLPL6]|nr:hypothetical protein BOM24_00055 [Tatumella sp. OPLPL6]
MRKRDYSDRLAKPSFGRCAFLPTDLNSATALFLFSTVLKAFNILYLDLLRKEGTKRDGKSSFNLKINELSNLFSQKINNTGILSA